MISLTSTAQGLAPALRQGRSRACASYQRKIAATGSAVMTTGSSHSGFRAAMSAAAEGGRYRFPDVLYFPYIGQCPDAGAPPAVRCRRPGDARRARRYDGPPEAHALG